MQMKKDSGHRRMNSLSDNRGAAMMVAVVIIGILMVFVFSLLLVSYTLYASQNKKVASRRNSEAANSLAIAMKNELEDEEAYKRSDLWKYLRCNIAQETWPYYAPGVDGHGESEAFRYFNLDYYLSSKYFGELENEGDGESQDGNRSEKTKDNLLDGFPAEVQLCLYWMLPDGVNPEDVQNLNELSHNGIKLFMEIRCNTASQSYICTNIYNLKISSADSRTQSALNIIQGKDTYNPEHNTLDALKKSEKWTWELTARE